MRLRDQQSLLLWKSQDGGQVPQGRCVLFGPNDITLKSFVISYQCLQIEVFPIKFQISDFSWQIRRYGNCYQAGRGKIPKLITSERSFFPNKTLLCPCFSQIPLSCTPFCSYVTGCLLKASVCAMGWFLPLKKGRTPGGGTDYCEGEGRYSVHSLWGAFSWSEMMLGQFYSKVNFIMFREKPLGGEV